MSLVDPFGGADDLKAKAASVQADLTLNQLMVNVDQSLIQHTFRNLIDNAVKFCRHTDTPTVTLHTEVKDGRMLLCVQDNGCGFDMKYHDRIFGIFQRLQRAEDYQGTGLGLATVYRLAVHCGAAIDVEVWAVPLEQEPAPEFWHQLDLALNRVRERLSFAHGRQTA